MSNDPDAKELSPLNSIIHRKQFAIANSIIMVVFIVGNLLLPQVFYYPHNELMFALGVFSSGVWGTQASYLGVYAALANQSIIVRLTWFSVGLSANVFSILLGLQLGSHGLGYSRMDVSLAAIFTGIAFVGSSLVFAVGLGIRTALNVRLEDKQGFHESRNQNYNLAFLFRLTTAIAILMLVWTLAPIRFSSGFRTGPTVEFAKISLLTMLLAFALIAAVLQASLATAKRRIGFLLIPILLMIGTPLVVIFARIVLPNSLSFWFQLSLYIAFLSGLVLSLLIVGTIWRRTGMRLIR